MASKTSMPGKLLCLWVSNKLQRLRYWRFCSILNKVLIVVCIVILVLFLHHVFAQYDPMQKFSYPPDIDLDAVIAHHRNKEFLSPSLAKLEPSNPRVYRFLTADLGLCAREKIQLLILVKTTHRASLQRDAIRATWGKSSCYPQLRARVLFLLGSHADSQLERKILGEQAAHGDIVQQNFVDNFYNNSLKIMMALEFLSEHCSTAKFVVLVHHDYLLNPPNLVRYIANIHPRLLSRFLGGYVWYAPVPVRKYFNKWRISRGEYPFALFPDFVGAGTMIFSSEFAKDLYIAMQFTKYFRLDDVFLGIILHKMHVVPVHVREVYRKRPKTLPSTFISTHGFGNPDELKKGWKESLLEFKCINKI